MITFGREQNRFASRVRRKLGIFGFKLFSQLLQDVYHTAQRKSKEIDFGLSDVMMKR